MSLSFAPYQPPPDEVRAQQQHHHPSATSGTSTSSTNATTTTTTTTATPWFTTLQSPTPVNTPTGYQQGYQSSAISEAGPSTHNPTISQSEAWNLPQSKYQRSTPIGLNQVLSADAYETRFSWRVDLESALAYLTPIAAILLLIFETKNDFVRIHAYQSLLLALPLAFLHFLLLWSSFLQGILFFLDVGLYGWLAYRTYHDAERLERRLIHTIGVIAEQWVEQE